MANSASEHQKTNFWTGFAFGGVIAGLSIYAFGTKKGRRQLKKILELADNLGEDLDGTLDTLRKELKDTDLAGEVKKISESFEKHLNPETKKSFHLSNVISKIKNFAPPQNQKQVKKFFVKDGKFLDKRHR